MDDIKALFDRVYDETYQDILRFIICKCSHLEDVNDIIQETYLEFYKILCKKEIKEISFRSYIYKIAFYKIKKHYTFLSKLKSHTLFKNDDKMLEAISDDIDIEKLICDKDCCYEIWNYIKEHKTIIVSKIFYLYYYDDYTLKEIADLLSMNESTVKSHLYRTIQEVKTIFLKEDYNNE